MKVLVMELVYFVWVIVFFLTFWLFSSIVEWRPIFHCDSKFYLTWQLVLNHNLWQAHCWPGYAAPWSWCKWSLFLVSLFELCPNFKLELQHSACILLGNHANTTFSGLCEKYIKSNEVEDTVMEINYFFFPIVWCQKLFLMKQRAGLLLWM